MNTFRRSIRTLMAILSHLITFALLLLFTYRLGSNLYFWRLARHRAARTPLPQPSVSVLVPARNEEATIGACVTSLLHQNYPEFDVIVLDDGSTDSTGAILDALAEAYPRLKVAHVGDTLPIGWNGKSYACHRLAKQAAGEWLLFTDADTQHSPQSIALGVAQAIALDVDLLSAFPAQKTLSWSERILVSFIVDFLPLVGLDFYAIWSGKDTRVAANGQYLLVRASSYRKAGGHAAIIRETLDDFALATYFRLGGYKIALIDGNDLLTCRMYRNAGEVWKGFSRSLMHGLDHSTLNSHSLGWALLFAWGYGTLFVNPFYYLVIGLVSRCHFGLPQWLALVEAVWLALLRGIASWYLHRSPLEILATPLAAWGVMALGLTALYRRWRGQKVNWKGRYYMG